MLHSVKVVIFGQDYILKGDTDIAYLQKIADLVDSKMKEVTKGPTQKGISNVALLAAINLADEYLKIKERFEAAESRARELSAAIDDKLE